MKPGSVWVGIALLAVGACGLLDAAGILDSSQTIGQWWPLAVIGWPLAEMLATRRVTLGGVVWAAVGLTLLADVQQWTSDVVVWSGLAVFVGLAVLDWSSRADLSRALLQPVKTRGMARNPKAIRTNFRMITSPPSPVRKLMTAPSGRREPWRPWFGQRGKLPKHDTSM